MLKIEVRLKKDLTISQRVTAKNTTTGEALIMMAVAKKLIRENDKDIPEELINESVDGILEMMEKEDKEKNK